MLNIHPLKAIETGLILSIVNIKKLMSFEEPSMIRQQLKFLESFKGQIISKATFSSFFGPNENFKIFFRN